MNYKKINNIVGWFAFAAAFLVYYLTVEPTASWWDCGEFIASAYKLEIGHPPGAPFFMLMGRFFSFFAFGNEIIVAKMVNMLSVMSSAFTILFLFWTISIFAKSIISPKGEPNKGNLAAIIGSALVGSLAYTFSDSFWFSAVEGEVYAMSSFFTALVFWSILKWQNIADQPKSDRWLVFIAFMMGLSIGVHLLNLLAIPAITFVYYYKKFKTTKKGIFYTLVISFLLLIFVQYGIIPGIISIGAQFELLFVNEIGLGFGSGFLFYVLLIIGFIIWALRYSAKKGYVNLNTAVLSLTFILIGYSTYALIVIRANAGPPLNENEPDNVFALKSYLNREQYGDRPLLHGQYYNAEPIDTKNNGKNYIEGKDEYEFIGYKTAYVYDPEYTTIFPRMHSSDKNRQHPTRYKVWAGINGDRKPTFGENLRYFFRYQIGHMYFRYFMWNFAGRQNNIQGPGYDVNGNKENFKGKWVSGIPFIDKRLGPMDEIPEDLEENQAYNKFYMLPLILGLIGFIYQYRKRKKDTFIVALLFLMTGLILIIYLNQPPIEPRERDYTYAGSFYAFTIWIGLGVAGIYEFLRKRIPALISAGIVSLACLFLVPGIMGKEGWDDHSRANKYAARDIAINYLESCAPNAILVTNGDNDTFPLWYAQEVEGRRTDVRVVNYILASGTWYVHQLQKKAYDSEPLPLTLTNEQLKQGTREYTPVVDMNKRGIYVDIKQIVNFIANDNNKQRFQGGREMFYIPTTKIRIPVDSAKVAASGIIPDDMLDEIVPYIDFEIKKRALYKNDLMLLDFIATNDWERPIYFVNPSSVRSLMNIEEYCHMEGMVYRFLPVRAKHMGGGLGGVDADKSYDLYMNTFQWGNLHDDNVYVDPESYRNVLLARNSYGRVAKALSVEGKRDEALQLLDRCQELFPDRKVIFDFSVYPIADAYYEAGNVGRCDTLLQRIAAVEEEKLIFNFKAQTENQGVITAEKLRSLAIINQLVQRWEIVAQGYLRSGNTNFGKPVIDRIIQLEDQNLNYFANLYPPQNKQVNEGMRQSLGLLQRIAQTCKTFNLEDAQAKAEESFNTYLQLFSTQQQQKPQ